MNANADKQTEKSKHSKLSTLLEEITSPLIGKLHKYEFNTWWKSKPLTIPYWNHQELEIIYIDYSPNKDHTFASEADSALQHFLSKTSLDRLAVTNIIYKHYRNTYKKTRNKAEFKSNCPIHKPSDVWSYLYPREIQIKRGDIDSDHRIFIGIYCDNEYILNQGCYLIYDADGHFFDYKEDTGYIYER